MISGGIAGGASAEEVRFAYFVNECFAIWDFVEAVLLLASVAAIYAVCPILGGIFLVLGILTLLFAVYTYFHTMYLLWQYDNGNEEAGQELIDDMELNIIIKLLTFGLGRALRPIAKNIRKSRIVKVLGEELFETVAKNVDEGKDAVDEIDKMIRSLKKSGASEDVIKEFAEKFNKKGLDWLKSKAAFKFTDDELRKLAGLGDNLFIPCRRNKLFQFIVKLCNFFLFEPYFLHNAFNNIVPFNLIVSFGISIIFNKVKNLLCFFRRK